MGIHMGCQSHLSVSVGNLGISAGSDIVRDCVDSITNFAEILCRQMARDDIEGAGIDDRPSASAIAQHNGANINDQGHRPTTHYNDPSNNVAAPQPPALAHSALYSRWVMNPFNLFTTV
jgi:hypothetical protein